MKILLFHLRSWAHLTRVYRFETTYGHFYASLAIPHHLRFYRDGSSDTVTR